MPDGPHETPYGEPLRAPPERELVRTLPVIFILGTITTLYTIYVCAHLLPMLQLFEPANAVDNDLRYAGMVQALIFNVITLLLVISYLMCILVHPGEVPNEPPWLYTSAFGGLGPMLQEAKKTGERRHCKWCGKYKPDRCHHCRVCKTCVLKMDHHCPWIYNCVGYHNYKFFFLLLFYTALDTNFILWTMMDSMVRAIDDNAPFLQMFFILFGLTLAFFLGTLATLFFGFHVWLTSMGLTTIEFCEKKFPKKESQERNSGFCGDCFENDSPFNLGVFNNMCMVLGYNPIFWCLPFTGSPGDGLNYDVSDEGPSRGFETGRGTKKKGGHGSQKVLQAQHDASLAAGDMLQSYGLQGYGTLFQPANSNGPSRGSRGSFGGKGGGAIWGGR